MPHYQHTQPGTLMRVVFGSLLVIGLILLCVQSMYGSPIFVSLIFCSVMLACLLLFHSLTVSVSDDWINVVFGIGLVRKRFPVELVQNISAVRNRWIYGWGIKYTPHGWLYNVSGFDAVEISLRGGRTYRIGTDEPSELHAAIRQAKR